MHAFFPEFFHIYIEYYSCKYKHTYRKYRKRLGGYKYSNLCFSFSKIQVVCFRMVDFANTNELKLQFKTLERTLILDHCSKFSWYFFGLIMIKMKTGSQDAGTNNAMEAKVLALSGEPSSVQVSGQAEVYS